ncbi:MAG: type IV pilus modification protein PilV [Brachymonas sp.]|nr:type IV pilus modification protein PilV [Brachymonas sp.]
MQRGFSLIEVLVAVAVLSLGLLGAVAMQYMALQDNRSARLQSVAVGLGREMAEMMRGNKVVSVQTDMANPYLGRFVATPLRPDNPSYCLAVGQSCSDNEEIARAQVTEWLARVESQLPGTQVVICLDDEPYDAKGLPRWACQEPAADAANPVTFIKIGWTHQSTNAAQVGANRLVAANAAAPFVMIPVTPGHDD